MGFPTSRFAGRLCIAFVAAIVLLGPAAAPPAAATSPRTPPIHEELERFADALKAQGDRASAAAVQRAVEDNRDTISDLKSECAAQIEAFRALLNDQKAKFDKIGEDAALDAWSQTATNSWTKSWKETWADMHRSALEALDGLQEWLAQHPAPDEPIPV